MPEIRLPKQVPKQKAINESRIFIIGHQVGELKDTLQRFKITIAHLGQPDLHKAYPVINRLSNYNSTLQKLLFRID